MTSSAASGELAANLLLDIRNCFCPGCICARMALRHHFPLSWFIATLNGKSLLTIHLRFAFSLLCKRFVLEHVSCRGGSPGFAQSCASPPTCSQSHKQVDPTLLADRLSLGETYAEAMAGVFYTPSPLEERVSS